MLTLERTIEEITHFDTHGNRALTLYLTTDPSGGAGANLPAHIDDLFRELLASAASDEGERGEIEREWRVLAGRLRELGPPPRGLAVFSCPAQHFFATVPLPRHVSPEAHWNTRFNVRPLLAVLDEYERTLVVLADREKARIFRVFLDQIDEIATIEDEIPGRHSQGGYAQGKYQRDHEKHVLWHTRRVVDALARLSDRAPTDHIFTGGPPEELAELNRLLPKRLRSRVKGEIKVPLFAKLSEVYEAVRASEVDAERQAEAALVDEIMERTGAMESVLGPDDTLTAVLEDRCFILAVAEGTSLPGGRCPACDALTLTGEGGCPFCGAPLEPFDDVVSEMARRVVIRGGRFDEVHDAAAASLAPFHGIAGLVRYPTSPARTAEAEAPGS